MAKRTSKLEIQSILLLIIISLPLYLLYLLFKFGEAIGWVWIGLGISVITGGYLWHKSSKEKALRAELKRKEQLRQDALMKEEQNRLKKIQSRHAELIKKYGDEKLVEAIMNGSYWQGQTAEQLTDSLGHPYDVDERVLKTKKKEIWKYNHMGGNRFGLRVTLENNVVVGWDEKT